MDTHGSRPPCGRGRVCGSVRRRLVAWFAGWACVALVASAHAAASHDTDLAVVREILTSPEADIDLTSAKLTIDRLIDPGIDVTAALSTLDAMAASLKAALPADASRRQRLEVLRRHLYAANAWNGNRPFHFDLDDPLGTSLRNKLLTSYLATRKGNCISMPMLFVALGQRLGLDLTIATAPNHVFVKYRDDDGAWLNLETTSGAGFTRDAWMRQQFPMSDEAIASGIYLRALGKKEAVVVMVGTLLEFYRQQGLHELRLRMARMALDFSPTDVDLLLHQHGAWLWFRNLLVHRCVTPDDLPADQRARLAQIDAALRDLYERAYALGWRPASDGQEEAVRQRALRAKQAQKENVK